MTTVYFMRHGETDYNKSGIVQGGGIDSTLNKTGYRQAQAFFDTYGHIRFDALYASTLQRTHQTLSPFVTNGYQIETHEGLNELYWGVQEGQNPTGEAKTQFRTILSRWKEGFLEDKVEGGESPLEGWARAEPFISHLGHKHPGETILICSHGRQLRIILSAMLGYGLQNMHLFNHHNTGLNIIRIRPNGIAIAETLNDISHLKNLSH